MIKKKMRGRSLAVFSLLILFFSLDSKLIFANNFHGPDSESCTLSNTNSQKTQNSQILTYFTPVINSNEENNEDFLLCSLRTLNTDTDLTNLSSSYSPLKIYSLVTQCNDLLFYESQITPNLFSHFSNLLSLSIQNCKIKFFPPGALGSLGNLKKLSLNTGNSEWGGRSLELSPSSFFQTPLLTHLNLGQNHIWSLPPKLLCSLHYLEELNLTNNLLSSASELGLTKNKNNCLTELKILDLSHNTLRNLNEGSLDSLRRLEELSLEHNWIDDVETGAFSALISLKKLNLSSNRISTLPPSLFSTNKQIRSLDLHNNTLNNLPPGLLSNLEHLLELNLSYNSLTSQWITVDAFKGLFRLVILNLAHNQLTHLTSSTFSELYTLQSLDLSSNLISTVSEATFGPLSNLHTLNLSRNKLVIITPRMFDGLYVLHKLNLDYNKINNFEEGAMSNLTSLSDLGLVGNELNSVPYALRGLKLLETLDLGENRINNLTAESFSSMSSLIGLRLVANSLVEIPNNICEFLPKLRVFNAASNNIVRIGKNSFAKCPQLRALRLDSNKFENVPLSLIPQLPNLLWFNMSRNLLKNVDYAILPPSLEWLDISYNSIEKLSNSKKSHAHAHHNAKLRVVDASHNRISILDHDGVPPELDRISLANNLLSKISADSFSKCAHLRKVDLTGNNIENLPLSAIRLPFSSKNKNAAEFLIGGNPFLCDCEMEWLTRINLLSSSGQYPTIGDLDTIVCKLANEKAGNFVPLPDMRPSYFLCPYKFHCFQTCQCCEFDACDCSMTCPNNCSCYHGDSWTANVVNCGNSAHKNIPALIPMDSTQVYLDGNFIQILKSHSFIGRKSLKALFLNNSNIEIVNNKSFNGLQSLELLHLDGNKIKKLDGFEFESLFKLRELYLQNNYIATIANTSFIHLKELEILRLDGNKIKIFSVWQLGLNPYLVQLGLSSNEWSCECGFLQQLSSWVRDNSKKIIDLDDIKCIWNNRTSERNNILNANTTCGSTWALTQDEFDFNSALPLIIALSATVISLILIICLVLCFRSHFKLCVSHCFSPDKKTQKMNVDEDFRAYDSYFIYSAKDEEFITKNISDELESSENYKFCLQYRDVEGEKKDFMLSAAQNSKSLLVSISRNFLTSEWASREFRSNFTAIIKNFTKCKRNIIVVFIENIQEKELSNELRSWIRRDAKTVLVFNEKKFWSKLKFSLPEPCSHYHSNLTSHTTTSSASSADRNHKFYETDHSINKNFNLPKYNSLVTTNQVTSLVRDEFCPEIPNFLFQPNSKSPVPFGNFGKNSNYGNGNSQFLNNSEEHVYSSLDPPSPPANFNFWKNKKQDENSGKNPNSASNVQTYLV